MTMNASDFSAEIEDRVHTEANIEISDFKYPINRLSDAVRDFLVSIGEVGLLFRLNEAHFTICAYRIP